MIRARRRRNERDDRPVVRQGAQAPVADGPSRRTHDKMRIFGDPSGARVFPRSAAERRTGDGYIGCMARAMDAQIDRRTCRHGDGAIVPRREIEGRIPGVGRWIDPGIERDIAGLCGTGSECSREAPAPVAVRDQQTSRDQKQHNISQRPRVAPRQIGARRRQSQLADVGKAAAQMRFPERFRVSIACPGRERIRALGDRTMRERAVALDLARAFEPSGPTHAVEREIEHEPRRGDQRGQNQGMEWPRQKHEDVKQRRGDEQPGDAARRP